MIKKLVKSLTKKSPSSKTPLNRKKGEKILTAEGWKRRRSSKGSTKIHTKK